MHRFNEILKEENKEKYKKYLKSIYIEINICYKSIL